MKSSSPRFKTELGGFDPARGCTVGAVDPMDTSTVPCVTEKYLYFHLHMYAMFAFVVVFEVDTRGISLHPINISFPIHS